MIDNTWLSLWSFPSWNMSPKEWDIYHYTSPGKDWNASSSRHKQVPEHKRRFNHLPQSLVLFRQNLQWTLFCWLPSPHASAYKMKWNLNTSIYTILHYCCCIRSLCSNQVNCILPLKFNKRCWEQVTYKYFSNHKSGTWDEHWNKLECFCKSVYR